VEVPERKDTGAARGLKAGVNRGEWGRRAVPKRKALKHEKSFSGAVFLFYRHRRREGEKGGEKGPKAVRFQGYGRALNDFIEAVKRRRNEGETEGSPHNSEKLSGFVELTLSKKKISREGRKA